MKTAAACFEILSTPFEQVSDFEPARIEISAQRALVSGPSRYVAGDGSTVSVEELAAERLGGVSFENRGAEWFLTGLVYTQLGRPRLSPRSPSPIGFGYIRSRDDPTRLLHPLATALAMPSDARRELLEHGLRWYLHDESEAAAQRGGEQPTDYWLARCLQVAELCDQDSLLALARWGLHAGLKGVPDVIVPRERTAFAEIKAPGDRLRKEQRAFLALAKAHGCIAGTIHVTDENSDTEEFRTFFRERRKAMKNADPAIKARAKTMGDVFREAARLARFSRLGPHTPIPRLRVSGLLYEERVDMFSQWTTYLLHEVIRVGVDSESLNSALEHAASISHKLAEAGGQETPMYVAAAQIQSGLVAAGARPRW